MITEIQVPFPVFYFRWVLFPVYSFPVCSWDAASPDTLRREPGLPQRDHLPRVLGGKALYVEVPNSKSVSCSKGSFLESLPPTGFDSRAWQVSLGTSRLGCRRTWSSFFVSGETDVIQTTRLASAWYPGCVDSRPGHVFGPLDWDGYELGQVSSY